MGAYFDSNHSHKGINDDKSKQIDYTDLTGKPTIYTPDNLTIEANADNELSVIKTDLTNVEATRTTSNQSITASTSTVIIFNNEISDSLSEYNNSTGVFTADVDGKYNASVSVKVSGDISNAYVLINTNFDTEGYSTRIINSDRCNASGSFNLSAGDTIFVRIFSAVNTAIITNGNRFSIDRVIEEA